VNNMTRRTTTGTMIAGMIVGSRQRHHWIDEPRFLQSQKHRIGTHFRAESALAQLVVWLTWLFIAGRIAELSFFLAAAFEHAQHIARLRNFPAVERIQVRQDSLAARLLRSRRWKRLQ